jgi:hypothetical protein
LFAGWGELEVVYVGGVNGGNDAAVVLKLEKVVVCFGDGVVEGVDERGIVWSE